MNRNSIKVHFQFSVGDMVYHKLSSNQILILERHYQDGTSGEGEIQYLGRSVDENMIDTDPTYFREIELECESSIIEEELKLEDVGE